MKRRKSNILLGAVIFATVFAVAVPANIGAVVFPFSDGFEDGNADDWVAFTEAGYTPGTISVDPAYARASNYGMRRYQPTSGSTHYVNFIEQTADSYVVEFDFKPISGRSYFFIGGIPHDRTTEPNGGIVFDLYDNAIRPYGSSTPLQTFNYGQWYHVKMIVTVESDYYQYYVDGNYMGDIIAPYPFNPHKTFQWHQDDVGTGDDGYLDNVKIREEKIIATIDIDPDTLNRGSKGKMITCYIELPESYDVKDIDASTILLECPSEGPGEIFHEDFDTDVFASGDWVRSDSSVQVDTSNGWLNIGADVGVNDYAEKTLNLTLPIVLESRMKLVSGGLNYRLPYIKLYHSLNEDEIVDIIYLSNKTSYHGGWRFNGWTFIDIKAPSGENVWSTVRAIIRSDGGELMAKDDGETAFTTIINKSWSIPDTLAKVRFSQPWDSICNVDYITIQTEVQSVSISPILDPKYGFVKSEDSYIMDHDGDGIPERMVKFDRNEVEDLLAPGTYNLKVTGELTDGTLFEGYSDEITVIDPP